MNKYKASLIVNINKQLEQWLSQAAPVPNEDVYRFLHSIQGTAGTIGLLDLAENAQRLQRQAEEREGLPWSKDNLRVLLVELIRTGGEPYFPQDITIADNETSAANSDEDRPLVILLDDDATLLMYMKEGLEQAGWSVIATPQPLKAIDYYHDMMPDCFILDLNIPATSGFEVMRTIGEKMKAQYVPTMVISVDCERATRFQAYRMGADDFMCKPLDMEEVIIRLERQLARKKRLERVLFVDELTGAYNRKYMQEPYEKLQSDMRRSGNRFSVAVLDLDRFKQVNDKYGHLVGDEVLSRFASFIKAGSRATDIFIRYGGEEFVLLMPRTGQKEAALLIERLIGEFTTLIFDSPQGPFSLSFSAGVVEASDAEHDLPYWLEKADIALYAAKKAGRRRVEIFDGSPAEPVKRKLKVAVVDDDALVRSMVAEHIKSCFTERLEAEIRPFGDGASFLEDPWRTGAEPVLVLLDGMMPRMDGMEVLQRIRELPDAGNYIVVMLTGRKAEQDIVRALQLGADDYVTKPFSLRELEARIKRLCRNIG
ncbi:diguanylate cyclase [Paenibacillus thalictri]|uniref:Diguanylate cyclase n=1 Tax=Paenibacillus thalictri TaxID=2527873 RepID=A0A4Q9DMU2_9BACL|nr:diguanylate cyclase [Paenibacillus thalictri]TBL74508.1 diguanylate cyclase [Paenibacillus thalictri]